MTQNIMSLDPDQVEYDPVAGLYINKQSGICLTPDEFETIRDKRAPIISVKGRYSPPTVKEYLQYLLEVFTEGYTRSKQNSWKPLVNYPEMKIGQTMPYDSKPDQVVMIDPEEKKSMVDIDQFGNFRHLPNGELSTYYFTIPEIQEEFRSQTKMDLSVDCVNTESSVKPVPDETAPTISPEFFEAQLRLLQKVIENPELLYQKWINLYPYLVDFLIDNMSVSYDGGEVSVEDLLSAFASKEVRECELEGKIKLLEAENSKLRQDKRQLRDQYYGKYRRNTNFHMK